MGLTEMYPTLHLYIAGEVISTGPRATLPVCNPATGDEIGRLPVATLSDLELASASSGIAFREWRKSSPETRRAIFRKAAKIIRERRDVIAQVITLEQGKPLTESQSEVEYAIDIVEWCAEELRRIYGRTIPSNAGTLNLTVAKEPVGPIYAVAPWNFPFGEALSLLAPSLASGCTAIVKPSEETPASTLLLGEIFSEAGLPAGCLNVILGDPEMISNYLVASKEVRKIAFTGSVAVGKKLAALAGAEMKPVTMELGGNAPAIVCADADLDLATKLLAKSKFYNAGQVCTSPNRLLVHDSIAHEFQRRVTEYANNLVLGPGLDHKTDLGPLINTRRVDIMRSFVDDAVGRGACMLTGGQIDNAGECFFRPTVFSDVPEEALMFQNEIFGPIAAISTFENGEDVVVRANSMSTGLAGYLFTSSEEMIEKCTRDIEVGVLAVNSASVSLTEAPFGGVKESGIGRIGGLEGFENFMQSKLIVRSRSPFPSGPVATV